MSLSKLFQILVPLYANVRWLVEVLYNVICNKSRLRLWRALMLERLVNLCKTAKTVDARTTDLSLSFTSLLNKQEKRERETKIQK